MMRSSILHPKNHQLDLKHYFYECISVSIPYRKVHPDLPDGESGCDPEMLKKLKDHLIEDKRLRITTYNIQLTTYNIHNS